MLNEARADMVTAPHVALFPSLAIFFTVLAFNLLGDGLRDALDPKLDRSNGCVIPAGCRASANLPAGPRDAITDVAGVTVGHHTLTTGRADRRDHGAAACRRSVPAEGPAGVAVINGFGKSTGLVQVQELGVLESPIALTNTFAVGTVATALMRAAVAASPRSAVACPRSTRWCSSATTVI
jgi:hypothetical protein